MHVKHQEVSAFLNELRQKLHPDPDSIREQRESIRHQCERTGKSKTEVSKALLLEAYEKLQSGPMRSLLYILQNECGVSEREIIRLLESVRNS